MAEGMLSVEDRAIIEAESNITEFVGGTISLGKLQQLLAAYASEEAGGAMRLIETRTQIFSEQAAILKQLIIDRNTNGAEAALASFPFVSTGEEVKQKYGIAKMARKFLEERAVLQSSEKVDFDPTKAEEELDLII
jgi:hypothetical protein